MSGNIEHLENLTFAVVELLSDLDNIDKHTVVSLSSMVMSGMSMPDAWRLLYKMVDEACDRVKAEKVKQTYEEYKSGI